VVVACLIQGAMGSSVQCGDKQSRRHCGPKNFCDATDPVRDNANNNGTLHVAATRNTSTQCTSRNPPLKPKCPSVCLVQYFVDQEFGRDATGNHAQLDKDNEHSFVGTEDTLLVHNVSRNKRRGFWPER
jgi:hypothetical protein